MEAAFLRGAALGADIHLARGIGADQHHGQAGRNASLQRFGLRLHGGKHTRRHCLAVNEKGSVRQGFNSCRVDGGRARATGSRRGAQGPRLSRAATDASQRREAGGRVRQGRVSATAKGLALAAVAAVASGLHAPKLAYLFALPATLLFAWGSLSQFDLPALYFDAVNPDYLVLQAHLDAEEHAGLARSRKSRLERLSGADPDLSRRPALLSGSAVLSAVRDRHVRRQGRARRLRPRGDRRARFRDARHEDELGRRRLCARGARAGPRLCLRVPDPVLHHPAAARFGLYRAGAERREPPAAETGRLARGSFDLRLFLFPVRCAGAVLDGVARVAAGAASALRRGMVDGRGARGFALCDRPDPYLRLCRRRCRLFRLATSVLRRPRRR